MIAEPYSSTVQNRSHRLVIDHWRPTSYNELHKKHWHWGKAHRRKKGDFSLIKAHALLAGVPAALGKRRVSLVITLTARMRQADPDAYWKSLLDALVRARLLVNDTATFVELGSVTYAPERGRLSTTIVLEDLEPVS